MISCRKKSVLLTTVLAVLGMVCLQGRSNLRLRFLTTGNTSQQNITLTPSKKVVTPGPVPVAHYTVIKGDRLPLRLLPHRDRFPDLATYIDATRDVIGSARKTLESTKHPLAEYNVYNPATRTPANQSYHDVIGKFHDVEVEHRARLENLKRTCNRHAAQQRPLVRGNITDFYYSRNYNFAYCKVPKSASTFWTKLFMALIRGDAYAKALSKLPRIEIHVKSSVLKTSPVRILRAHVPTIIVSRNPYTRLFSAYVDKVYLPLFWSKARTMDGAVAKPTFYINQTHEVLKGSNKTITQRLMRYREKLLQKGLLTRQNVTVRVRPICANNVTFEQFLAHVIADAGSGQMLDPHWAPISHLCHPCRFNTFRIVKQEYFTDDVEFTLRSLKVDLEKFPTIHDTLHENRAENSIPSIIGVLHNAAFSRSVNTCINHQDLIKRAWTSLKIQGFIRNNVPFPKSLEVMGTFNKYKVTDAVLDIIQKNPMTSQERDQQRHSHLVEAYKTVSKNVLDEIKNIYHMDFLLFNYSITPPS